MSTKTVGQVIEMCILRISLGFIVLLFVVPALAQEPSKESTIKIDTTLVSVPVVVSDRQGRYVADLKQEDFTLYQDRIKQPISFFAATEEPINIALLLDTSRSTRDVLDDIKKAAITLLKQVRPQDSLMVIAFDYNVHVLCPLTTDRKALERAVKKAEIGEFFGTTLNDAVTEVLARSFKSVKGRKAIILLTDGKDAGSKVPPRELVASAEEADTLIYPIFYTTLPMRRNRLAFGGRRMDRINERASDFLHILAETSAGRFYASEVTDLKTTFGLILEELRHQYRLGFYPDSVEQEGKLHRLNVEVNRTDVAVRARRSYRSKRADAP